MMESQPMSTPQTVEQNMQNLKTTKGDTRFEAYKAVLAVSADKPELIYPHWDTLVEFLRNEGADTKFMAVQLIANTVRADSEKKFEKLVDEFYKELSHESIVVAPHVALSSAKIIKAKPHLMDKITGLLLNIDKVTTCKHPELVKAYVIEAFDGYIDKVSDKRKIIAFVNDQADSTSPKTRKIARTFLKKWQS
jgi:hypothetical protein